MKFPLDWRRTLLNHLLGAMVAGVFEVVFRQIMQLFS